MNSPIFNTNNIQAYKNMPDLIAEALKEAILQGQYKGGVQLKQDEIAKRFDVSLIPVREALIQLEAQKLVKCIRNKGAVVTTLSIKEMKMIFELRKILEIGSITLTEQKNLTIQIDKMKYLMSKMENEKDIFAFGRYDRLFHELLCETACNAQLSDTYRNIFVRVERYLMYVYHLVKSQEDEIREHQRIIQLLEKSDIQELTQEIANHIEKNQANFITYLENTYDYETLNWNDFLPFSQI
ncbi:MAG: GntR family transcriptional regulator [Cellulosilyticaceae bacterium]